MPILTGMLKAWAECKTARTSFGVRLIAGLSRKALAIWTGSRVSSALPGPVSTFKRMYASRSRAVELNATGPLGSIGSNEDSGFLLQLEAFRDTQKRQSKRRKLQELSMTEMHKSDIDVIDVIDLTI